MVSNIFILDEHLKTQKVLTVNGRHTFFNDLYTQDFSTGAESYEFSTNACDIEESYYVMFLYKGDYKLFQIIEIEQEHSEGNIISTIYAESACLELINGVIREYKTNTNEPVSCIKFLSDILTGTNWGIGRYSSTLKDKKLSINIDKTTQIWSVIQEYMPEFGYEISTRVIYENGRVKAKLIDVYDEGELGDKTYKRFEYGRNTKGIIKKKDLYDFCTALIIETDLDIKNSREIEIDGYIKAKNDDVVVAPYENSRYNYGRDYIYGVYEDIDSVSVDEAVKKAVEELKRRATPKFDYEVDTALTYKEYEDISLGDTVYVIDRSFNPAITLEARVGTLEISFTDRNNCKCNLTNYKEITSKIDAKLTGNIQTVINTYFPIMSHQIDESTYEVIKKDYIQAEIGEFEKVIAEEFVAKEAYIEDLKAVNVEIEGKLTAEQADIKYATIANLDVTNADIDRLEANIANIDDLYVKDAEIDNLIANSATITGLDAKYATLDLANINKGCITQAMIGEGVVGSAQIADGSITDAKIVELTANLITAGTLSVDRLLINGTGENGEKSLLFTLNNLGELVSTNTDTLDGGVLTEKSITADKLVAKSITAEQIASKTITANEILANSITGNEIAGNTITGNHISGNTITANHIQSNSITADKIASNSITADKITVGDFTNYFTKEYNSEFTGIKGVLVDGYMIRNDVSDAMGYQHISLTGKLYSLNGGEKFRITGKVKTGSGTPSTGLTFKVQGSWRDVNGDIVSGSSTVLTHTTETADFKWTTFNDVLTVASMPSNASYYSVKAYIADETKGRVHLQAFTMTRMASGELIVDGAISGHTINSAKIYSSYIASDNTSAPSFSLDSNGQILGANIECNNLSADNEISTSTLIVDNISNKAYPKALTSGATLYVNSSSGDDDNECLDGNKFATLQGAINSIPKNMNGKVIKIQLENNCTEDVDVRYFSSGTLRILFNGKKLLGYMDINNCSASVYLLGGDTSSDSASTGVVHPTTGLSANSRTVSVNIAQCNYVSIQYMKVFGSDNQASGISDGTNKACILGQLGSNIYVNKVAITNSEAGFRAVYMAHIHANETSGIASKYGFQAITGGKISFTDKAQAGGNTKATYSETGGQIWLGIDSDAGNFDSNNTTKGYPTFATGTTSSESNNTSTTTTTKTVTYTSNYGDTYRLNVYTGWKKDGTVRQGDWGYGDCKGCWFFGDDFTNMKSKSVSKVVITFTRQSSSNGNNSAVEHKLYVHNYESRPSGNPSLSTALGTVSLSRGGTGTLTITDSTKISAIKSAKGIGLMHDYDKAHYSVCSGTMKVKFYYT